MIFKSTGLVETGGWKLLKRGGKREGGKETS